MTTYSKYNIIYRLQKWLDSVPGQTFMNYAYSWGASIVIMGALFKLTHLPGANFWLFLGMGTEVLVFFISGFDRPFDKTEDGKDLPTHVNLDDEPSDVTPHAVVNGEGRFGGSTQQPSGTAVDTEAIAQVATSVATVAGSIVMPEVPNMNPELEEATNNYVEELKRLTDMLTKVSAQSERLARDSEEMENLNRTLTGICKIYEMQLKGASQQIGTIDEINEQTRRMADQIAELNKIYARMIEAMTVNMPAARPAGPTISTSTER